jgi:tRNA pseudouridine38-40 synthase
VNSKAPTPRVRYAITLEYDGTYWAGFQYQHNAPTIQAALEEAIAIRFSEKVRVHGASRTDAGVHAAGQVAAFDLAYRLAPAKMPAALNSALPATIRVLECREVPNTWDPQRLAKRKRYQYLIYNRQITSPFYRHSAWQIPQPLDLRAMARAARFLVGERDFAACQDSGRPVASTVRRIFRCQIIHRPPEVAIRVEGNGFLYHMVRIMTGTMVECGLHKMQAQDLPELLLTKNRALMGPTAPPQGLTLHRIIY